MMCFPTSRRGLLENLPTLITSWLGMSLCLSFNGSTFAESSNNVVTHDYNYQFNR